MFHGNCKLNIRKPNQYETEVVWFDGTAQLDPTDPLFHEMGLAFLEEQDKLFGSYGVYAADPFTRALLR